MKQLNPRWIEQQEHLVESDAPIDRIESLHIAAQALIVLLAKHNRPFKVYNLGGGAKRITTETDICPCCKRTLSEKDGRK